MNKNLVVKPVEFLGDVLMAAQDADGNIWAGVSWICNGIGLNKNEKDRQVKNIQAETVLKRGCVKFDAGVFDPNNATLAVRLDFVPLWLAKISITPTMQAENPNVADKLVQYQLKAKDVLAAAFLPTEAQRPLSQAELILQQAQFMVDMERRQKEQAEALEHVNKRLDDACDLIALNPNAWREDCRRLIVKIAQKMGGNEFIREVQAEAFKLVDERAGASLETRLTNKRRRMADEGVCKSKRDKLNKVDVIADDKKLIEVYMHIVKQMAIKYGVGSELEGRKAG